MHRNPEIKYTQLFINNEFVNSSGGKQFEAKNPTTDEVICKIHEGDKPDIDRAVQAARHAFKYDNTWRTIDASDRGQLLYKLAELVERDCDHLAALDSLDTGKHFKQTRKQCLWAVDVLRYYAGWADKIQGNTIPTDGKLMTYTRFAPIGVCGLILPFTVSLYSACLKLSSALTCGNTVVIKPSEHATLSVLHLAKLVKEAGFPPGVVNVVPGFGRTAGAALASHMDVDHISFSGSTEVGKLIQTMAGQSNMKRVTLKLGGNSPLVVCEDADLEIAAMHARVVELAKNWTIGDPFDERTKHCPQIDANHFNHVMKYIEVGVKEGAHLLAGGKRSRTKGFYIEPTVFADVSDTMTIAKDEIYGPVMVIIKFRTFDDVIHRCNDSHFGLASGIFTHDINKAMHFSHRMRKGNVWVNTFTAITPQTPYGGWKHSGVGCEGGQDGLYEYLEVKTV
ncbi:unnamed protein product [Medioppia subpectinata]|uniref:Aldehyde dehydrogenase domain-containing protein n=1 Tax=Medioppia subpectinata TaxID=1979941 RepID=A0A7R9KLL2_9ACAR|nr:unnamed protein product [Medioppia subpectinata]CAG2105727.1 unnamed protein product [Medioppia subpectinata]